MRERAHMMRDTSGNDNLNDETSGDGWPPSRRRTLTLSRASPRPSVASTLARIAYVSRLSALLAIRPAADLCTGLMLEDDMQLEGGFRETKQNSRRRPSNTAPASPPSKSGGPTLTLTKTPRRHLRRFLARRAQRSIFANFSGKCERSPILVNLIMGDNCCALNLQRHAA